MRVFVRACASAGGMTAILEVSAQTPTDLFKSNVQAAGFDFSDFTSDNLLHNKKVAEGVGAHPRGCSLPSEVLQTPSGDRSAFLCFTPDLSVYLSVCPL